MNRFKLIALAMSALVAGQVAGMEAEVSAPVATDKTMKQRAGELYTSARTALGNLLADADDCLNMNRKKITAALAAGALGAWNKDKVAALVTTGYEKAKPAFSKVFSKVELRKFLTTHAAVFGQFLKAHKKASGVVAASTVVAAFITYLYRAQLAEAAKTAGAKVAAGAIAAKELAAKYPKTTAALVATPVVAGLGFAGYKNRAAVAGAGKIAVEKAAKLAEYVRGLVSSPKARAAAEVAKEMGILATAKPDKLDNLALIEQLLEL